jgi:hypothetical protein
VKEFIMTPMSFAGACRLSCDNDERE